MPFEIDTSGVEAMVRDLAVAAGHGSNTRNALDVVAGKILDTAIDYTPMASRAHIRERAEIRFLEKHSIRGSGDLKVTMNDGTRKGENVAENVWLRSGGKFYIMRGAGRWPASEQPGVYTRGPRKGQPRVHASRFSVKGAHWPDRIWQQYQSLIDQTPEERTRLKKAWIAQALASQGLARQSWMQIADTLGLTLSGGSDRFRQVRASDGNAYINGTARRSPEGGGEVYVELENSLPFLARNGGVAILQRAIDTRLSAFETEVKKGVFQDLQTFASRYQGLDIQLN